MHAQFSHLAETYFSNFDYDVGERELGHALSFDHDLDTFAASLGLVKSSIEEIMKEDGKALFAPHSETWFDLAGRYRFGNG